MLTGGIWADIALGSGVLGLILLLANRKANRPPDT
jgi:hypothetical protein